MRKIVLLRPKNDTPQSYQTAYVSDMADVLNLLNRSRSLPRNLLESGGWAARPSRLYFSTRGCASSRDSSINSTLSNMTPSSGSLKLAVYVIAKHSDAQSLPAAVACCRHVRSDAIDTTTLANVVRTAQFSEDLTEVNRTSLMHFFRQKAPISATVRKKVFQCKVLTGFYHPQHWPCYSSFSGSPGKWLTIVRSPFTCKLAAGQTSTTKTVIIRLYSHNIHAINSTIKWQICCDKKYYFQRLLSITNENLHNYWLMLIDNISHCWRFKTLFTTVYMCTCHRQISLDCTDWNPVSVSFCIALLSYSEFRHPTWQVYSPKGTTGKAHAGLIWTSTQVLY